jgi:hypothetical protein
MASHLGQLHSIQRENVTLNLYKIIILKYKYI